MENVATKPLFSTRDLYLASTLIFMHFEMLEINYQQEGNKPNPIGYFNFADSEELRDTVRKYTQGLLNVEPRSFITCMRALKADITNFYKNPNKTDFASV
jgi:hypothetical protein